MHNVWNLCRFCYIEWFFILYFALHVTPSNQLNEKTQTINLCKTLFFLRIIHQQKTYYRQNETFSYPSINVKIVLHILKNVWTQIVHMSQWNSKWMWYWYSFKMCVFYAFFSCSHTVHFHIHIQCTLNCNLYCI